MRRLRFATWNLRWAGPGSAATPAIRRRLERVAPEVAVLTEARTSVLEPDWPYLADGGVGVYRGNPVDGAKVAIVSRVPMEVVDRVGDESLPPGNFLAVDVDAPGGPLRVIGIVVRYDQKRAFIDALPAALERNVTDRTVLAGDFNLALPGRGLAERMEKVLAEVGLRVVTAGPHEVLRGERTLKDHIAVSSDLSVGHLTVWPRRDPSCRGGEVEVSDHAGVAISISG